MSIPSDGHQINTAATDAVVARRDKVMALRVAGFSLRKIAKAVGISHETVRRDLTAVLAETRESTASRAEELRTLTHSRLESLINRLWAKALPLSVDDPLDYQAVEKILRAIQIHARVMGYDAPQKHQVDLTLMQSAVAPVVDAIIAVIPEDSAERVQEAVMHALASVERELSTGVLSLPGAQ